MTEHLRQQAKATYDARPDIREALATGRTENTAARNAAAVESNKRTAGRTLNRAAHRAGGKGRQAQAIERLNRRARDLGHADLETYLRQAEKVRRPLQGMADDLEIHLSNVVAWRRRFGIRRGGVTDPLREDAKEAPPSEEDGADAA